MIDDSYLQSLIDEVAGYSLSLSIFLDKAIEDYVDHRVREAVLDEQEATARQADW